MITPRNRKFDLSSSLAGVWHSNDIFKTVLSNALSIPLPSGEKLFVESIRIFMDKIKDKKLFEDARLFIAQESIHRREHQAYNEALCSAKNYNLRMLEMPYASHNTHAIAHYDPKMLLAITVCMEHATASISENVICNKVWLEGVDETMKDFWSWHALEEIEHRAVAFDIYNEIYGDKNYLDDVMKVTIKQLIRNISFTACQMFSMEKLNPLDMRRWLRESPFLVGVDGIIHPLSNSINAFYCKSFSPSTFIDFNKIEGSYSSIKNLSASTILRQK